MKKKKNIYSKLFFNYRYQGVKNAASRRKQMFRVQCVLSFICWASLITTGVFYACANYVVSSVAEWIMCCSFMTFFLTFYRDSEKNPRVGVAAVNNYVTNNYSCDVTNNYSFGGSVVFSLSPSPSKSLYLPDVTAASSSASSSPLPPLPR